MIEILYQWLDAMSRGHTEWYVRMDNPMQKQVISNLLATL
jgi:hypothetical protein